MGVRDQEGRRRGGQPRRHNGAGGGKGVKGAYQLTRKAVAAQIEADLRRDGKAQRLVQSRKTRLPRKLQGFPGRKHTAREVRTAAGQLIKSRQIARGSVAAGFIKAAQAFGKAGGAKVSAKGNPGKSYGRRATPESPTAVFANLASGAEKIGGPALQQGMDNAAEDMLAHAGRKMAEAARRLSR